MPHSLRVQVQVQELEGPGIQRRSYGWKLRVRVHLRVQGDSSSRPILQLMMEITREFKYQNIPKA